MGDTSETAHGGSVFVMHERLERYVPHAEATHTEHGLTYLEKGWFSMEHGGAIEARPGTLTLVPAGAPHRALGGEDMSYWLCAFCSSCLSLDESQPLMAPFRAVRHGALPVLTVPKSRRRRVVRLFRDLEEEQRRDVPESEELVRALVVQLLGEARRAMPMETPERLGGTLVSDALETIQKRGLEPISLRDVAAAVHRTPAHVASAVKKATGYSVGEWLSAGRVAQAAARLSHTDEGLDAIAEHVGWKDKTHLIRQFKKAYGVTPAAWRRARREEAAAATRSPPRNSRKAR